MNTLTHPATDDWLIFISMNQGGTPAPPPPPDDVRITNDGDIRITNDSNTRIINKNS